MAKQTSGQNGVYAVRTSDMLGRPSQVLPQLEGAENTAQFMTITFDCTDFMKQSCPAAVHIDGTARPQLIKRELNPGYYDILREYEKHTGVATLINTSFNMHEEPLCAHHKMGVVLGRPPRYLALGLFLASQPSAETPG